MPTVPGAPDAPGVAAVVADLVESRRVGLVGVEVEVVESRSTRGGEVDVVGGAVVVGVADVVGVGVPAVSGIGMLGLFGDVKSS